MDHDAIANRVDEFNRRNGGDAILVNGFYLYSNGATRDANPLGLLCDPPKDELETLKLQKLYHGTLLDLAKDDFVGLKQQLASSASATGYVDNKELQRLQGLQRTVQAHKMNFDEAVDNIANHPRVQRNLQLKAEEEQRKQTALSLVNSIEI